jgi:hypothetical protein
MGEVSGYAQVLVQVDDVVDYLKVLVCFQPTLGQVHFPGHEIVGREILNNFSAPNF